MKNWLDALKLMRIPFSFFLMPVFWFAFSDSHLPTNLPLFELISLFLIIHLLVYPASNGYNSYCDKDEDAVGGLATPPKVNKQLYYLVIVFDVLATLLSFYVNIVFGILMLVYIIVSKAYSWEKIRLKKHPIISTLVVCFFQGFWIYLSVFAFFGEDILTLNKTAYLNAAISSLFLLGSYPLTQIYQHKSDDQRGDKTLSLLLGLRGTLFFAAIGFGLATLLFVLNHIALAQNQKIVNYFVFTFPIIIYFGWWSFGVFKNPKEANFKHTMRMNAISSMSMSALFMANSFV
jgi:4-hydroxybenzoate polyprenyltransferase